MTSSRHRYRIKPGESTIKIAQAHGLLPETIWDHPENAELRRTRPDMNVLRAGDQLVVPERQNKCVSAASEKRHRFRRKAIPARLKMQLLDHGEPRRNLDYELNIDGQWVNGSTDDDGVLDIAIPASASKGRLIVGQDQLQIEIAFGGLDPIAESSGVQTRLNNLGYDCGSADGVVGARTQESLKRFQLSVGLPVSGQADAATRSKLLEMHDTLRPAPGNSQNRG